jgi:hypothetical protein
MEVKKKFRRDRIELEDAGGILLSKNILQMRDLEFRGAGAAKSEFTAMR